MRILVVEDDLRLQTAVADTLREAGYAEMLARMSDPSDTASYIGPPVNDWQTNPGWGLYIVAKGLILIPLLYRAESVAPGLIEQAAQVEVERFDDLDEFALELDGEVDFLDARPAVPGPHPVDQGRRRLPRWRHEAYLALLRDLEEGAERG